METRKTTSQHFRSDKNTDREIAEIEKIVNANPSVLNETGRITQSQIIRTAIHHYYAEVTNSDVQDVYVQLIRDQLSQVLQPMTKAIIDSVTSEIRKGIDQNNHDIHVFGQKELVALKIILNAFQIQGDDSIEAIKDYCLTENVYDKVIDEVTEQRLKGE